MKRIIKVTSPHITITATMRTDARVLSRYEVETARDNIADGLMKVVHEARYVGVPLNKVKVK